MPETVKVERSASLGAAFATALAAKDFGAIRAMLHPEIDFRGLTPSRDWEASDPDAVIDSVLRQWFERVVEAANLRLSTMSSGRYELERVDEAESKRDRTGLSLTVLDRHSGDSRSPSSLSGGETFYTSNEIYEGPTEERTVFDQDGADDRLKDWISHHRGRRAFFLYERHQSGRIRDDLPPEARASFQVVDERNNKFSLAQVDL